MDRHSLYVEKAHDGGGGVIKSAPLSVCVSTDHQDLRGGGSIFCIKKIDFSKTSVK